MENGQMRRKTERMHRIAAAAFRDGRELYETEN